MTSPAEFPALVSDFDIDWDTPGSCGHEECAEAHRLAEGEHYEHGFVNFENGYTASLMRAKRGDFTSEGFEEGRWEVSVGKAAPPIIKMILGMEYLPSREAFEALDLPEGVAGNLDNAAVNEFLVRVAQLAPSEPEPEVLF